MTASLLHSRYADLALTDEPRLPRFAFCPVSDSLFGVPVGVSRFFSRSQFCGSQLALVPLFFIRLFLVPGYFADVFLTIFSLTPLSGKKRSPQVKTLSCAAALVSVPREYFGSLRKQIPYRSPD
jgi:hypothetical protein